MTRKRNRRSTKNENLRHHSLDQILDGDHADDLLLVVHNGQMPNSPGHHLFHTRVDGFVDEGGDNVGAAGGNLPNGSFLGGLSEEGNLANVIALTDNSGHVSCCGIVVVVVVIDGGGGRW
jgi:hypothetical protein